MLLEMNNVYSIILPNERAKTYKLYTVVISIINAIGFGFVILNNYGGIIIRYSALVPLGLLTGSFVLYFFFKKNRPYLFNELLVNIFISGICWIFIGIYHNGILSLVFSVFGFLALKTKKIVFTENRIEFPSFPKKIFLWAELENVLLKDRILTLDFKNNKLLQFTLTDHSIEVGNEEMFNKFVEQQLQQHTTNQ